MMKRMLSGIKPTGRVTLGNYIGAIKPFVSYQDEYEMFIFIANLHSMTIYQKPTDLRKNTKDLIALYIAAGLDPEKVTLFLQSDVLEHAQLGWYLGCMVSMGELSRMTQYKDKKAKNEVIGAGIFNYPSLMNADILMYDPDFVPVGEDQKQHVELCRDIAERFNSRYSETFKLPEPLVTKVGGRIMDLQNPTKRHINHDLFYRLYPSIRLKKSVRICLFKNWLGYKKRTFIEAIEHLKSFMKKSPISR